MQTLTNDTAAMLAALVQVDFRDPVEAAVLRHPGAYALRDPDYSFITYIAAEIEPGLASRAYVTTVRRRFESALPEIYEVRHSKRRVAYRRIDLYGYAHVAGLAVFQVRNGEWDSKRSFGKLLKEYLLVDTFGCSVIVPHGKVRGACRTSPDSLMAPVVGAARDGLGLSRIQAVDLVGYARRPVSIAALQGKAPDTNHGVLDDADLDAALMDLAQAA